MQREIRVHGVSGTPPRDILYTDPITISPEDGPTKIYQRRDSDPDFDTIAFHWASLTSGSPRTALWILLAPYSLANAAGWMAGWRHSPTPSDETTPNSLRAVLGRIGVRAAGLILTALFVVQTVTAAVVLPQSGDAGLRWGPFDISFDGLAPRSTTLVLVMVVAALFYWLVAYVSTRSHFSSQHRGVSVTKLLFQPSGKSMEAASDIPDGAPPDEDPAGAGVGDPRLWGVHPMLHRLRRLHLGLGFLTLGLVTMVITQTVSRLVALVVLAVVALLMSAMTTHRPKCRWTWLFTSWTPLAGLAVFVGSVVGVATTDPNTWQLESVHSLTLGVAAVLGVFVALSLLAGPLSAGALVLATFIGAVLGTTVAVVVDRVLGVNEVAALGVGWVAVAMLILVVLLIFAALLSALTGHREPEYGATRPLPECAKLLGLVRRAVLEARVLFYVAAAFGLATFVYGLVRVWDHGKGTAEEGAGFREVLRTGIDPAAFDQFPPGLTEFAIWLVILVPGLFALRSITRGWKGGRSGEDRRRQVGILWDLGSFWPRWFHPLAPPSYGPKAIEDLQVQLDQGSPDLILAAHSQGSLISAVAISLSNRATNFITYGSQLGILYPRMFPETGIGDLVDEVAGLSPRWFNLWRDSDYIGGHFVEHDGVENWRVSEGKGHSGYEMTEDYRSARGAFSDPD